MTTAVQSTQAEDLPGSGQDQGRDHREWRRPLVRGLAVLSGVAAVVAAVAMAAAPHTPPVMNGHPVLPPDLPRYRVVEWSQSSSPLKRVAWTFRFNGDDEWGPLDATHRVLVGEDLETIRYADEGKVFAAPIVSEDGFRVATGAGMSVRIEDLSAGTRVEVPIPQPPAAELVGVAVLGWSPDARVVYAKALEDRQVWEVESGASPRPFRLPVGPETTAVVVSPDGIHVAIEDLKAGVSVLDRGTGREVVHLPGAYDARSVVWLPDGRRLVRGTVDGLVVVDASTGRVRRVSEAPRCQPLVALSEQRILCHGSASTREDDHDRDGFTLVDVSTGHADVVARAADGFGGNPGMLDVDVAEDLARTWAFSSRDRWVPRPSSAG